MTAVTKIQGFDKSGTNGSNSTNSTHDTGETAWDNTATGTMNHTNAQSFEGGQSIVLASGTGTIHRRWYGFNTTSLAIQFYLRCSNWTVSADTDFMQARTSVADGEVRCASLSMSPAAAGRFQVRNNASSTVTTSSVGSGSSIYNTLSNNTWYRFEVWYVIDTGNASGGRVRYEIYDVSSGNPGTLVKSWDSGASVAMGTALIDRLYGPGVSSNTTRSGDWYFDEVKAVGDATGFIGVAVPITSTLLTGRAIIIADDGDPPFDPPVQTSGTTTTPVELDDGATSGTGVWYVEQHATDTLVYTVTDSVGTVSSPYNIGPIGATTSLVRRPPDAFTPGGTSWE